MRPTQHPSNNGILRAPAGATVEECRLLAITRVTYADGTPAVQSYWELTDAERKAIAEGAKVQLSCWGNTHPPVWIGVDGVEEPA